MANTTAGRRRELAKAERSLEASVECGTVSVVHVTSAGGVRGVQCTVRSERLLDFAPDFVGWILTSCPA
jgi:hypothetical protein